MQIYHKPVLLEKSIEYLDIISDGIYVDATLGGGGHSYEILKRLSSNGMLISIDMDKDAIENFYKKYKQYDNWKVVRDNFANIKNILTELGINKINGILYDLGVSSYQLNQYEKGFSYRDDDAILDMNMGLSENSAINILNNYSQDELERIFKEYGELKQYRAIARRIIEFRKDREIKYVRDIKDIVEPVFVHANLIKELSKLFQAIRIEVNRELENLKRSLEDVLGFLDSKGRIVVISYHSLEDRIVKDFFKLESSDCICPPEVPVCNCRHKASLKIITKKPIVPDEVEVEFNIRARSAKLRVAEKI